MASRQHFPATTQSRSRYGASPATGSSQYHASGAAFGQKSALSTYSNTSFNTNASFVRPGTSLLYTSTKPKPIASRNTWKHTFSIPVECGKRGAHGNGDMGLFSDPHLTKLSTGNNRRIVCGGLQWDIYIHPNQGESSCEFALSVFPVKTSTEDEIPDNYRLRYTVTAALSSRVVSDRRSSIDRDDFKASQLDSEWSRTIEEVVYDAQPADAGVPQDASSAPQIDWRATMERLSFSTQDLLHSHVDDEDYFDLEVSIRTEFVRKNAKRSQYTGVLGAILLQSEAKLAQQADEIEALDQKKDAFVQSLQAQLKEANELNRGMTQMMERLSLCQQDMQREMGEMKVETQKLGTREKHNAVEKEKAINRLQEQAVADKDEIQRLMLQVAKLKQQLASADQHAQLEQLLQTQMHMQAQAMSHATQPPQSLLQQENYRQRLLHQQQQQQAAQHPQPIISAAVPPAQPPQQPPPPQAHLSSNIPPATHGHTYPAFPQAPVSSQKAPQQTATTHAEPSASSYAPRVISQPAFESYQPIVISPSKQPQQQPQQVAPAIPPMPAQTQPVAAIPSLEAQQKFTDAPNFQWGGDAEVHTFSSTLPALEKSKEEREEESSSPVKGASEELQTPNSLRNQSESRTPASQERPRPPEPIISGEVDLRVEEMLFEYRPVRAWRWDAEQKKWRGRGRGQLKMFYHREKGMAKLLFTDEKHNKTRLTQWVDGCAWSTKCKDTWSTRCELLVDDDMRVLDTEVEWAGVDYTMYPETPEPMVGKWKLMFPDNPAEASAFREIFNEQLDAFQGATGGLDDEQHQEQQAEQEDNLSTEPFTFEHAEEPKIDSFGASTGVDFSSGLNDAAASNWASSFGHDTKKDEESKATNITESSSFGNINWSFGNDKPDEAKKQSTTANSGTAATSGTTSEPQTTAATEDNGADYTFKPIVHLDEVEVGTGHEDETLVAKVEYLKLYRFGKDVSGCPCWKNRGTRSAVYFYKHKENGKVRLISREEVTNKLRMNQLVPREDMANFMLKQARVYSWNAYDVTIAAEEEDEAAGMCAWSIKFETESASDDFAQHFKDAMQQNAATGGPATDAQRSDTPELLDALDNEAEDSTAQEPVDKMQAAQEEEQDDAERYKGWKEEEIMADKVRRQKAAKDAEAAKLFSSGDSGNQTTSWNMNAFDSSQDQEQVTNMFANVDFEAQRGVDLQAEAVLNKIAVDPTISFGIGSGAQQDQDANAESNGATGLGLTNFSFGGSNGVADEPTTSSWGATTESADKADSGWGGGFSGGFSSVQVTDGFGNASWGTDANGDSGGFGSFGNNNDFSVAAIQSEAKPAETTQAKGGQESGDQDAEDNGTYTLKPIVQLDEVDVNSGHEQERELDSFEIAKLYRWGKDVTGDLNWKQRASNTKLQFWQNNVSGKIRIVCREAITNKLRLNQIVNTKQLGEPVKMSAKQTSWIAQDVTIEAEDDDDKQGVCKFACKFIDEDTATNFTKMFISSGENNMTVG